MVIHSFQILLNFQELENLLVSEKINDLLNLKNPTVAPYANLGEVKLRITARAKNEVEAKKIIKPIKEKLKKEFSKFIFGENDDTLPSVLINELAKRNETIVFAESCTGGLLSSSLLHQYQALLKFLKVVLFLTVMNSNNHY